MGVEVVSLGCRMNLAESERCRPAGEERDLVVINSCAVTAGAAPDAPGDPPRAAQAPMRG
jgi:tRNA A37 methylthiotransferase MiaB